MRPALLSVADQIMLKRELAKLRSLTAQNRVRGVRRHQGGGVKRGREEHVQVWTTSGSPTIGDVLAGNASNIFPARVRSFFNGTVAVGQTCWLGFVDWYDADTSQTLYAIHGKHYYARRAGSYNSGGTSLPFFVATQQDFACFCKPDAAIAAGASGTVSLYNDDFTDSTLNRASTISPFVAVAQDEWCFLTREMGTYIVNPVSGSTAIYRGVTDAAIAKGASGTVSRYSAAGVDTTINDTVTNLFADVAISKKVIYGKIETTFFMVAAEC
jgi:hypothetical protein